MTLRRCLLAALPVLAVAVPYAPAADRPAAESATWSVSGQVLDGLGSGVKDAAVQIEVGGDEKTEGRVIGRASTDETGDFTIRLPGKPKGALHVRVRKERFAAYHATVEFPDDQTEVFVDVELSGTLAVRGKVMLAATSRPVAEVAVSLAVLGRQWEARTDSSGRFDLRGVSPGSGQLTISHDGYSRERRPIRIEEGMPEIEVLLYPERPLRVRVVDERGRALAGADVEMQAVSDFFTATTDERGYADLHGIHREVTEVFWRVAHPDGVRMLDFERRIDLSGEADAAASRPAASRPAVRTLVLPRGGKVAGKVVDAEKGEPVITARVLVVDAPGVDPPIEWTDGEGEFEIAGLVPGPIAIAVQHADYAPELIEDEARAGWTRRLTIRLGKGKPLGGMVVNPAGTPIPQVQVVCTQWRYRDIIGLRALTDDKGCFRFDHAPGGPIEFAFQKPGVGALSGQMLTAGRTDYRFTLAPTPTRPASGADAPTTTASGGVEVGKSVPDFTVTATDGTKHQISQLRGKYVFVEFWATWCPPCRAEMPALKKLHARLGSRPDFVMLGISMDDDAAKVTAYAEKEKLGWPMAAGPDSGAATAAKRVGARFIPFNFLVGPDGKVIAVEVHGDDLPDRIGGLVK